jgi:hypothetical protein
VSVACCGLPAHWVLAGIKLSILELILSEVKSLLGIEFGTNSFSEIIVRDFAVFVAVKFFIEPIELLWG